MPIWDNWSEVEWRKFVTTIGPMLKAARENLQISASKMASMSGIPFAALKKIEAGYERAYVGNIAAIWVHLPDVHVNDVLARMGLPAEAPRTAAP